MNKSTDSESDLKKLIAAACVGLIFISETDSPIEPFFGRKPSKLLTTEIEFEKFFDRQTTKKDWHTKADRKNTEGFEKLKALLEDELSDLQVYKTGSVQVEIFVIGRSKFGKNAGVRMKAIET